MQPNFLSLHFSLLSYTFMQHFDMIDRSMLESLLYDINRLILI